jgi:hypothetical protein
MEADISIWRKTGHFYFALTRPANASQDSCYKSAVYPSFDGEPFWCFSNRESELLRTPIWACLQSWLCVVSDALTESVRSRQARVPEADSVAQ